MKIKFKNLTICSPEKKYYQGDFCLNGSCIADHKKIKNEVDLNGYTVYPGLINAHDHLLGTYFPRVGNGPYLNWKPWDEDLKKSDLYRERGKIPPSDLYQLGFYRQVLSGVTTVSDHIPHKVSRTFSKKPFINVIKNYALAHECSSYDLKWGNSLEAEIRKARQQDIPFITHIEEGYDEEAINGIPSLKKVNGLFKNTVLIHCISCNKQDIKDIAAKKANMVWCPFSNTYMFGETADIDTFLKEGVNVSLGTDSPMSGGLNLLEEMKTAASIYKKICRKELPAKTIFEMVTINGAKAYKQDKEIGSLKPGKAADFILLKQKKNSDPYHNLTKAGLLDIEAVFRKGVPLYFKEKFGSLFKVNLEKYQKVTVLNKEKYYLIGKPLELLSNIRKNVGFKKYLDFFPLS